MGSRNLAMDLLLQHSGVGVGVGELFYDFEDDTIGVQPAGFSELLDTGVSASEAYQDPLIAENQLFRMYGDDQIYSKFDDVGPLTDDVLISGRLKSFGGNGHVRIMVRHDGRTGLTYNCYMFSVGTNQIHLYKITDGAAVDIGTPSDVTFTSNVWYNFKAEAIGTTLRFKFWETVEPDWQYSDTDAVYTAGYCGIGTVYESYWDDIRVTGSE